MVSPAAILRFTLSLDKSWGSRGSCLSRMWLIWVLGQMVSSSAQACRAAQNRPCRLAGATGAVGPPTLQDRLKTPSKQVRQDTRS